MSERTERAHFVYGPVPSRRLGLSLGIDLLPHKTCSYDCLYCQLGRTAEQCVERKKYVEPESVLQQVREALSAKQRIDYITFSGSGEPTLHSGIGFLIGETKKLTAIPVAVITNSSFLAEKEVRDALRLCDLVVPSLDAGRASTFQAINRPHSSIQFEEMVVGIIQFSREFSGQFWLEIMLVAGINDTEEELTILRSLIADIRPDRVQLNTVVRPPSEATAQPVKTERLREIAQFLGHGAEGVNDFRGNLQQQLIDNDEERILSFIKRRPATVSDIVASLGIHRDVVMKLLGIMEERGHIKSVRFEERRYYEPV